MGRRGLTGVVAVLTVLCPATLPGAAAATELCKTPNCTQVYESGQLIEGTIPEGPGAAYTEFVTNSGTVTCTESEVEGETSAESGEPLPGVLTGLTFGSCQWEKFISCTVSAVNLPYNAAIEESGEANANGTLVISAGESGNPGVQVTCGVFVNCTATASELEMSVEGGSPAYLSGSNAATELSGSSCPETAEWRGEYFITQPEPLIIGLLPSVLCTSAPDAKGVCPKGTGYGEETISASLETGVAKFETYPPPGAAVSCKGSFMEGAFDAEGWGQVTSHTFSGEGEEKECESTFPETPKVEVTMGNTPFTQSSFGYYPKEGGQGELWYGPKHTNATTTLKVSGGPTCVYKPAIKPKTRGLVVNGTGGAPTQFQFFDVGLRIMGSLPCPIYLQTTVAMSLYGVKGAELANVYLGKSIAK